MPSTLELRENGRGVCVARWYDPATGEFLSVDPDLAETDQPYTYAGDDPVNAKDPSGLVEEVGDCGTSFLDVGSVGGDTLDLYYGFRDLCFDGTAWEAVYFVFNHNVLI